jgi:Patatin-like phospholipase
MDATPNDLRAHYNSGTWRPLGCDRIALVLQGGGALGAYQAGVYQALHEADIEPDWVSGVSIGAIKFGDHCGQLAKGPARSAPHILGAHHGPQDLALHARRRRVPQGAKCSELVDDHDARAPGVLLAAPSESLAQLHRRP